MTAPSDRIHVALANGRPLLGLYLIPGFPDWETSQSAAREAAALGVSFIEFPILVEPRWSQRTGGTIARALTSVADETIRWSSPMNVWASGVQCGVGVVYPGAWPDPRRWSAPAQALELSSALLLESDPDDWDSHAAQADAWGAPLIAAVDGRRSSCTREELTRLKRGGGFVYVSLGDRTGSRSAEPATLTQKVAAVREIRPDLPVCCAFGLREPEDVREVLASSRCDGVIVGTAALEALRDGVDPFRNWLERMLEVAADIDCGGVHVG